MSFTVSRNEHQWKSLEQHVWRYKVDSSLIHFTLTNEVSSLKVLLKTHFYPLALSYMMLFVVIIVLWWFIVILTLLQKCFHKVPSDGTL